MELPVELDKWLRAQGSLTEREEKLVRDAFHYGAGVVLDVLRTSPNYPLCDSALKEIELDLCDHIRGVGTDRTRWP
ncbi:MAG: hypothetical protein AAF541_22780 [Pseudomonadota bacterium]